MKKENFITHYDENEYKQLCAEAYEKAPKSGLCVTVNDTFSSMVPHDISDDLWKSDITVSEKVDLLFELYREMPCYAYLMYLMMEYKYRFSDMERKIVHQKFVEIITSDNEPFKGPVLYSLWCDYFEDIEFCALMWNGIIDDCKENRDSIEALLKYSGPVEWVLKKELFEYLLWDESWHEAILTCLYDSVFDVYGDINRIEAIAYTEKLAVNRSTETYRKLYSALLAK